MANNNLESVCDTLSRRALLRGLGGLGLLAAFDPMHTAEAVSPDLTGDMQRFVDRCRNKGIPDYNFKVRQRGKENFSIVVYDIERGDTSGVDAGKLVAINQDVVRWAASMNKVYALLAYWHQVHRGRIKATSDYTGPGGYLEQMIRSSINPATNKVIKKAGGPAKVTEIADYYGMNHTTVAYIPGSGRTTANKTTAHDLNIFLNTLYHREFPHSEEMIACMGLPNKDRVYDDTCIPRSLNVDKDKQTEIEWLGIVDKTGTIYGLCGEAALLTIKYKDQQGNTQKKPYTFIATIEDRTIKGSGKGPGYIPWARSRAEIIRSMSEGVYWHLIKDITGVDYKCSKHNGKHLA